MADQKSKLKSKIIPFDVTATEVRKGVWEWEVEGVPWRYEEGAGLNLTLLLDGGHGVKMCYCKTLHEAGIFTQGFYSGQQCAK